MFKGCHFPTAVILMAIRWYCRYKMSYRDIEELMAERGVEVDHATVNRWVVKFAPRLLKAARGHKATVGTSWRMDETYIKVRGHWKYLYRAVDKAGHTVDFLLTSITSARPGTSRPGHHFVRHAGDANIQVRSVHNAG